MLQWLWLVPFFPFLGFVLLISASGKMPKSLVTVIGSGSIGLAALVTGLIAVEFLQSDLEFFRTELWIWMEVGRFQPGFALYLDGLSLCMLFVITGIGFLIHLYAAGYMHSDDDFPRFFTYTNLFITAMLMLVLADNLVLLFLGWEGVGLCSFLLIGFWYKDPENGLAARKAFIVTRIGDTAFAIGLFLLFKHVGTLDIQAAMSKATLLWTEDNGTATLIAALLLGGAVGKSAQLPLQTWLPDAMAGPTPVSALIHAATMVTAGVYLIARNHALFELSPVIMHTVAIVGVLTLLMAGFTALTQTDLKRVLAYSTISQIGYMFLALGVGAWSSAIFHLMTHAFFKALLFLTAGTIILSVHHQQNIFKMGGLRKKLPLPFWLFLIGCLGLIALPPTSGFFSKEAILNAAWSSHTGGPIIWIGAVLGAFMTALYTFRMFFIVFYGEQKIQAHEPKGWLFSVPLIVLAVLTLAGGALKYVLPDILATAVPHGHDAHPPMGIIAIAILLPLVGVITAYLFYYKKVWSADSLANSTIGKPLHAFFNSGWAMDWLYDALLVKPYIALSRLNKNDVINILPNAAAFGAKVLNGLLVRSQNGQLRFYVGSMAVASLIVITLTIHL
ncbi:MAG: NADH-quinone oxidoreductase subunit L [Flavobacteriales bacterium]|jgi:NADH-quinone oxidoreductase subunit L